MIHVEFTVQRRHLFIVAGMLLAAVLAIPGWAWASHQFSDVPDSDWAHDDIAWLADAGITQGCGGGQYCPDDYVTRRELAVFLHRLSGGDDRTLDSRLDSLEGTFSGAWRNGDTLILDGMNLQIRNGAGATHTSNARGNLIIGYNHLAGWTSHYQDGSHYLVIGDNHTFRAYGGIVAGDFNRSFGSHATILSGHGNIARGNYATIVGGAGHNADAYESTIVGGSDHYTWGDHSTVVGGASNTSQSPFSTVAGGDNIICTAYIGLCAEGQVDPIDVEPDPPDVAFP